MTTFYVLAPEVPGGFGVRTELIPRPATYPEVRRIHFEFGFGSLGDDLIECHPVFMVTRALGDALRESTCSGFLLSTELVVSVNEQVRLLEPDWRAPLIEWLQVTGLPGSDDFGLTPDARLVVSAAALRVLRRYRIDHCEITPV